MYENSLWENDADHGQIKLISSPYLRALAIFLNCQWSTLAHWQLLQSRHSIFTLKAQDDNSSSKDECVGSQDEGWTMSLSQCKSAQVMDSERTILQFFVVITDDWWEIADVWTLLK